MGNRLKHPVPASWLAAQLGAELKGSDVAIDHIGSLEKLAKNSLAFSKSEVPVAGQAAAAVIAPAAFFNEGASVIVSTRPRLDFARALHCLERHAGFVGFGEPSQIHESVTFGRNVVIGNAVHIGAGTRIYNNVVIADGVRIGRDCVIKSSTVIGEEGFGFERDEAGVPIRILHLGSVVIGDNVELGSLNTVCRGTLNDTIIENNVKTDDHVHIAHNCVIREGALLTACVELSGGVEVGRNAWLGPNSSVIQKAKIGESGFVGIGAVVTRDVEPGVTVAGNPARNLTRKTQV
ncbi:MAG: UDP-3-O-(3-hydroxymyristoyl)glucosamine N-acyltransferase [Burkholderiaceae bacterium]